MSHLLFQPVVLSFVLIVLGFTIVSANDPETPYPLPTDVKEGQIFHIPTGYPVSQSAMIDAVTDARILYVAETHDQIASHRLQLTLLKALHQRYPGNAVLGMEIFTRKQQPILDLWVTGQVGEKDFLQQTGWYRRWGLDFDYYRDPLLFCRDQRIPVIGLNAEKALIRAIEQQPVSDLPQPIQQQIPALDLSDSYHRAVTEAAFDAHIRCRCGVEGFHRAQILWEETMADTIAVYLQQPENSDKHVLVAAGKHHICYGFGIPRRVFRRLPLSYQMIAIEDPDHRTQSGQFAECESLPLQPFHYLLFARPGKLPQRGVTLGVRMKSALDGVFLTHVESGSIAAQHRLQKGDLIVQWNQLPVRETLDLKMLLKECRGRQQVELTLIRQGKILRQKIAFH